MMNSHKIQYENRRRAFNALVNGKINNNPFLLFPLRIETKFRDLNKEDLSLVDYDDYLDVLKEISELQVEVYKPREIDLSTIYKKMHQINRRIGQIDMVEPLEKREINKILKNLFGDSEIAKIPSNSRIGIAKKQILNEAKHLKERHHIATGAAGELIKTVGDIKHSLAILSDFDRIPYRAISRLADLKEPYKRVLDRNDFNVSEVIVKIKEPINTRGSERENFTLHIGKHQFNINKRSAVKTSKDNNQIYTLSLPVAQKNIIVDTMFNSMIFISQFNIPTEQEWKVSNIELSYRTKGGGRTIKHLRREGIQWSPTLKKEDNIIKLQRESGANPKLKNYLRRKTQSIPTQMQKVFGQLHQGVSISKEDSATLQKELNEVARLIPKIKENINNIYNPTELQPTNGKHGRRPYVKVPDRIKTINDGDAVKEYLSLHQDSLSTFFEIDCEKFLDRTKNIVNDISRKELLDKNISSEALRPSSLIAEMLQVNNALLSGKIHNIKSQGSNFVLPVLDSGKPGEKQVIFKYPKEYDLFNNLINELKNNCKKYLQYEKWRPKLGWIDRLPFPFSKKIETGEDMSKQLCVRIFPDEIFISQFRKPLNPREYEDAKRFYIMWFIFSGNSILEKSLWNSLVGKYGVHRASWLVRIFSGKMKDKISKRPYNAFADVYLNDVDTMIEILNQRIPQSLSPNEIRNEVLRKLGKCSSLLYKTRKTVYEYKEIPDVLFDQMKSKIELIKQAFAYYKRLYATRPDLYVIDKREMELWDKDTYAVNNFEKELDDFIYHLEPKRRNLKAMVADFQKEYFNDAFFKRDNKLLQILDENKNFEPTSPILPDRFLFVGEWENGRSNGVITEYGRTVNPNLQLSFSEKDEEELNPFLLDMERGDVSVEGGLKWMFDYDEAVRNGMAITVPLSNQAYDATFTSIYVLGIKDTSAKAGTETLEELLYSHIYTSNSLDLLKVGTPTNQTETNQQHYPYFDETTLANRRYEIEILKMLVENIKTKNGIELLTECLGKKIEELKNGTAIDYLADYLGVDANRTFGYVNSFDTNVAQLPKNLLNNFLPSVDRASSNSIYHKFIKTLPEFIEKYVAPQGVLPSLRIGNMPYGILPTTDFSRLNEKDNKDDLNVVFNRLYRLLESIAPLWNNMFEEKVDSMYRIQTGRKENAQRRFMQMVSTNPYSVSYEGLKMLKNPFLPSRLHFEQMYKEINIEGYSKALDLSHTDLEKKDRFSYFPGGEMKRFDFEKLIVRNLGGNKEDLRDLIDLFSYRIDAWYLALANYQLMKQRDVSNKGIYIGAYGWLFNLKREINQEAIKPISDIEKTQVLKDFKLEDNKQPIYENRKSEGVMLAPSIDHAVTAAVMRSSYSQSKKKGKQDNRLSINLSSGRMQRAMQLLSGVSNGLSIGAVLGAQLERSLHEAYKTNANLELDRYIGRLRKKYPLNIDPQHASKESVQTDYPLQIINAATLLEDVFNITKWYESDLSIPLSTLVHRNFNNIFGEIEFETDAHKLHFSKLIEQIADTYDALNDLMLSEGVYQLVKGNRTALSALMNKMEHNSLLTRPEILDIPMRSINISHRVLVNFKTCNGNEKPLGWDTMSVLAVTEPSLNYFLGTLLGNGNNIGVYIKAKDTDKTMFVSLNSLDVSPIDYIYFSANKKAFVDFLLATYRKKNNDWKADLEIIDKSADMDKITISEQNLYVTNLRKLVHEGITLKASDFVHQREQKEPADIETYYDVDDMLRRIENAVQRIKRLKGEIEDEISNWNMSYRPEKTENIGLLSYKEAVIKGVNTGELDRSVVEQMKDEDYHKLLEFNIYAYRLGLTSTISTYELLLEQKIDNNTEEENTVKAAEHFNAKMDIINEVIEVVVNANKRLQVVNIEELKEQWTKVAEQKNETEFNVTAFLQKINKKAEELFVKHFKLYPVIKLNKLDEKAKKQLKGQVQPEFSYANASASQMENWLMDLAKVRKHISTLQSVRMNAMFTSADTIQALTPIQLPFEVDKDTEWTGLEFTDEDKLESKESTVVWDKTTLAESLENGQGCAGFVVDNWIELIPKRRQNAGAVFHYDEPNAEPPQALLLAISPNRNNTAWDTNTLINILKETKRIAGYRLVEPEMINDNATLSRILPITPLINDVPSSPYERPTTTNTSHYPGGRGSIRPIRPIRPTRRRED